MTQCFADSACCDRIVLPFDLVRYSCLPSDELGEWRILTVTYLALCDRPSHCHGAAPRKGGGTIAIWLPTIYSSCS